MFVFENLAALAIWESIFGAREDAEADAPEPWCDPVGISDVGVESIDEDPRSEGAGGGRGRSEA